METPSDNELPSCRGTTGEHGMSGSLGFGGSTSIVMQRVGITILDLGRGLAGAIDRFETGVRDLAKHPDARDASWAALFEALNERRGRERELAACALGHRRVGLAVSEQHLGR